MQTIIAGICSSSVRKKKNAERTYMAILRKRKHNFQRERVQFYDHEDSSTENEHPATGSFFF